MPFFFLFFFFVLFFLFFFLKLGNVPTVSTLLSTASISHLN